MNQNPIVADVMSLSSVNNMITCHNISKVLAFEYEEGWNAPFAFRN